MFSITCFVATMCGWTFVEIWTGDHPTAGSNVWRQVILTALWLCVLLSIAGSSWLAMWRIRNVHIEETFVGHHSKSSSFDSNESMRVHTWAVITMLLFSVGNCGLVTYFLFDHFDPVHHASYASHARWNSDGKGHYMVFLAWPMIWTLSWTSALVYVTFIGHRREIFDLVEKVRMASTQDQVGHDDVNTATHFAQDYAYASARLQAFSYKWGDFIAGNFLALLAGVAICSYCAACRVYDKQAGSAVGNLVEMAALAIFLGFLLFGLAKVERDHEAFLMAMVYKISCPALHQDTDEHDMEARMEWARNAGCNIEAIRMLARERGYVHSPTLTFVKFTMKFYQLLGGLISTVAGVLAGSVGLLMGET